MNSDRAPRGTHQDNAARQEHYRNKDNGAKKLQNRLNVQKKKLEDGFGDLPVFSLKQPSSRRASSADIKSFNIKKRSFDEALKIEINRRESIIKEAQDDIK